MNLLEVLLVADVLALLVPLVPSKQSRAGWLDFVPIGAFVIVIGHLVLEGFRPTMIRLYVVTGLLFGRSLLRIVRSAPAERAWSLPLKAFVEEQDVLLGTAIQSLQTKTG